jgi:hypothetical protein
MPRRPPLPGRPEACSKDERGDYATIQLMSANEFRPAHPEVSEE